MPHVTHEHLDRLDRIDRENEELHDAIGRDEEEFNQIVEAFRAVTQHPGIKIRCEGDPAAETWNVLARLFEPYLS